MSLVDAFGGIYKLSLDFEDEEWSLSGESLTEFVVLADLWEDEPEKRPDIEADMKGELRRFVERSQLR